MSRIILNIEGMGCEKCVTRIADGLQNENGVKTVGVSLTNQQAIIEGENLNKGNLIKIIEELGYKAK